MTGTIRALPGGRGYLKDREFDILRGEVRFIDPYAFDPDLDFLLETEVSSSDRDWRVSYMVTGPFSDWQINARSDLNGATPLHMAARNGHLDCVKLLLEHGVEHDGHANLYNETVENRTGATPLMLACYNGRWCRNKSFSLQAMSFLLSRCHMLFSDLIEHLLA